MEITLTDLQRQADAQIESRLQKKSMAEYLAAKGKRKYCPRYSPSQTIRDLLDLRQRLYAGEDPESISATLQMHYSHF